MYVHVDKVLKLHSLRGTQTHPHLGMEVKPTIPALRGNLNPLSSLKPLTRCQDLLKLRVCLFVFFFVSSQKELNVRQSGRQTVSL